MQDLLIFQYLFDEIETPFLQSVGMTVSALISYAATPLQTALVLYVALTGILMMRGLRWPASSRHRFALDKWSLCRLLWCGAAGGAARREGVAQPERRPASGGESHAAAYCGRWSK